MEDLHSRLLALAERWEQSVIRIMIYRGEYEQGRQAGEDAERLRCAAELRRALDDE